MPAGRTAKYAVWRACERIGIRPPNVPACWDDIDIDPIKADVLAYSQIRDQEENPPQLTRAK